MRKILIELGPSTGMVLTGHRRVAGQFGEAVAKITGEADVYPLHKKIIDMKEYVLHYDIIIISTYVKTQDQENAVIELITAKRKKLDLYEIRFNIVDE